jgi:fibronectin type 3 domain-containing protein
VTISSDALGSPTIIPLLGTGIEPPHPVSLTWNPSTSSVFGYYVYRATDQYGPYTRLNSTPITTTQYTDIIVQLGTKYLYWVTAVDSDTIESPFSDLAQVPAQ